MATDVAQVGGEAHGSIAWSSFTHFYVPGLNWAFLAILLVTVMAFVAAAAGLLAPRRFQNSGLAFTRALAALGPILGLYCVALVMREMAVQQLDGDPRAFDSTQAIATGAAAMSLMIGLSGGIIGVILTTLLRLRCRQEVREP